MTDVNSHEVDELHLKVLDLEKRLANAEAVRTRLTEENTNLKAEVNRLGQEVQSLYEAQAGEDI
jgi:FtsZ-binding cell division protein ZapB